MNLSRHHSFAPKVRSAFIELNGSKRLEISTYNRDDDLQSQIAIRRVRSKYTEWIKELNDGPENNDDRKKAIAILHWNQVCSLVKNIR